MDIHVTAHAGVFKRATSNPATVRMVSGGVGRNVAENLGHLGVEVRLLGAVGDDPISDRLLTETVAAGVDVSSVARVPGRSGGLYVALLDGSGELDTAASDMAVMDEVDVDYVERCSDLIRDSGFIVADANVPGPALQRLVEIANQAGVPVVLDPVSVHKAERVAGLTGEIFIVTPDAAEAEVLKRAYRLTVWHTITTLGRDGACWTDHRAGTRADIPARPVAAVDVTGAGDAFVAGLVCALHAGLTMDQALSVATDTAAIVVATHQSTVGPGKVAGILNRLRGE